MRTNKKCISCWKQDVANFPESWSVEKSITSDSSLAGRRLNQVLPSHGTRFQRAAGLVSAKTVSLTASCKPQLRSTVLAFALTSLTELPKPVCSTCTPFFHVFLKLKYQHVEFPDLARHRTKQQQKLAQARLLKPDKARLGDRCVPNTKEHHSLLAVSHKLTYCRLCICSIFAVQKPPF